MFLLDDLLMAPARGLLTVFRKLHEAARQELLNEGESLRTQLSELYLMLETGQVMQDEFDRLEGELLDRLEQLEATEEDKEEFEDEEEEELAAAEQTQGKGEQDGYHD